MGIVGNVGRDGEIYGVFIIVERFWWVFGFWKIRKGLLGVGEIMNRGDIFNN